MATATSRGRGSGGRRRLTPVELLIGAGLAGLAAFLVLSSGMAATGHPARTAGAHRGSAPSAGPRGAFAWLSPQGPVQGWPVARLASGRASVSYPAGWEPIRTDPGTASVAVRGPSGQITGYLNVTPKSGEESLSNWTRFRPRHVAAEGARDVRLLAAGRHVKFRAAKGSCVIDQYRTSSTSYREIACIVQGAHTTNVVVAAAQPSRWQMEAPLLERAVASFRG